VTAGTAMTTAELARAVRNLEITTRKAVTATFAGRYTSAFKGRGMEFDEVREYQSGDDVRSIDWNVSARTGRLHTKRYVEERELTILLLVDLSASGGFGSGERSKNEVAAEVSALLAFTAIRSNDRVGLILFTDRVEKVIAPRKGSRHVLRLIRDVLAFTPRAEARTSLRAGLQALAAVLKRRAVVFLVSDFQDRGYEALLKTAGRRHDLIAVLLADPREQRLPDVGLIELEDAETGERVLVDSASPEVRRAWEQAGGEAREALSRLCLGAGIDLIPLTLGEEPARILVRFFLARERRL
jgi:uncharacterized protein (DUF58 family)